MSNNQFLQWRALQQVFLFKKKTKRQKEYIYIYIIGVGGGWKPNYTSKYIWGKCFEHFEQYKAFREITANKLNSISQTICVTKNKLK